MTRIRAVVLLAGHTLVVDCETENRIIQFRMEADDARFLAQRIGRLLPK